MASGRCGILETAVKTAKQDTYLDASLKKLENYKISYSQTVVNHKNKIFIFNYNEGFDPSKVYLVNGKVIIY